MTVSQEAFSSVSSALSRKGIAIGQQELEALDTLEQGLHALDLSIDQDINVDIRNGVGKWSGSYPTLWVTANATLTLTAPNNADKWHVVAKDDYKGETIFDGVVTYKVPVRVSYKTGFKINLNIVVTNQTEPFNGVATVNASISL